MPRGQLLWCDVHNHWPELDRDDMMKRWKVRFDAMGDMTEAERDDMWKHVSGHDMPETWESMQQMLREAGFVDIELLYSDEFYTAVVSARKKCVI